MEERERALVDAESKRKSRIRLFALLVFTDLLIVGYIVYEFIALFAKR